MTKDGKSLDHSRRSQHRGASLAHDNSGAIMVMGVFMAVLLVGFMYYLIGVGETIFYRERMQDAADAGSWAAAVTSARGMNAIVMINLIMAALVAVLLAIKVILFLIQVGMVISGIMCAIPWTAVVGCPILEFLSDVEPDVQDVHDEVQNIVKEVVPILNKAQGVIAIATTALAEAKAIKTMGNFSPPVDSLPGVMVPGSLGLPVEDDTCDVLVAHAKRDLTDLVGPVFRAIPLLGPVMSAILGAIIDAANAVEGSVCGSGSGSGDAGQSIADQYKQQQLHDMGCDGDNPPDACSHVGECGSSSASCDSSGGSTPAGADAGSTDGFAPKKVKDDCNLGAECMQVRTVAFGTPNFDRTMQGVQAGNWGRDDGGGSGVYSMLQELAKGSVAEAEFYWDSHGDGDPDPDSSSGFPDAQAMRDNWMWEMNWRARLRRFHIPADSAFGSGCSGGPCGALVGAADMLNSVVVH